MADLHDTIVRLKSFAKTTRNVVLVRRKTIEEAVELLKEQQPEIIYCADCPKEDREECEKQYGRVQNEWNCRFGRRKGR